MSASSSSSNNSFGQKIRTAYHLSKSSEPCQKHHHRSIRFIESAIGKVTGVLGSAAASSSSSPASSSLSTPKMMESRFGKMKPARINTRGSSFESSITLNAKGIQVGSPGSTPFPHHYTRFPSEVYFGSDSEESD